MKLRVFIDTNVFIYAFEYPDSNSAKIIHLINEGTIESMISEQVVKEVTRYFDKYHGGKLAQLFRRYLLESCIIISKENIVDAMVEYRTQIKEKDLEQLAATKALGLKYLLSFDRD